MLDSNGVEPEKNEGFRCSEVIVVHHSLDKCFCFQIDFHCKQIRDFILAGMVNVLEVCKEKPCNVTDSTSSSSAFVIVVVVVVVAAVALLRFGSTVVDHLCLFQAKLRNEFVNITWLYFQDVAFRTRV